MQDHDLDLIPGVGDLARMAHAAPRQFGDVHQAFHPAEIDKEAEGGHVGYYAFQLLVYLQSLQQRLPRTRRGLSRALGEHDAAALRVTLDHLELDFAAEVAL